MMLKFKFMPYPLKHSQYKVKFLTTEWNLLKVIWKAQRGKGKNPNKLLKIIMCVQFYNLALNLTY